MERESCDILLGNALAKLRELPSGKFDCCVTSPPYYALRDYGTGTWVGGDPNCPHYRTSKASDKTATDHKRTQEEGEAVGDAIYKSVCPLCGAVRKDEQIGLESSPDEYVDALVSVFREVKRTLKDDGTLWLNIGDSYAGSGKGAWDNKDAQKESYVPNKDSPQCKIPKTFDGIKQKDLIGIPWLLAFALRADGWYLRQDIIWHKPNPMPEPVTDRCTKSHEYIFLLSKRHKYYFDYEAIQEDAKSIDDRRYGEGRIEYGGKRNGGRQGVVPQNRSFVAIMDKRNKRDVWDINTQGYKQSHFAMMPKELARNCILAGSRRGGASSIHLTARVRPGLYRSTRDVPMSA